MEELFQAIYEVSSMYDTNAWKLSAVRDMFMFFEKDLTFLCFSFDSILVCHHQINLFN